MKDAMENSELPVYIHVTRRGFLATRLMDLHPRASWRTIEAMLERIAALGKTFSAEESEVMSQANRLNLSGRPFPDFGKPEPRERA